MRKFYIAHIHSVKRINKGYRLHISVPKLEHKAEKYGIYMSDPEEEMKGYGKYCIEISRERMREICKKENVTFKKKLVNRELILLKEKDDSQVKIAIIPQNMTVDEELSFYPFIYDENGNHIELEFF